MELDAQRDTIPTTPETTAVSIGTKKTMHFQRY
jgi:hypothetical protein